jgi:hypothetical protein
MQKVSEPCQRYNGKMGDNAFYLPGKINPAKMQWLM